MTAPLFTNVGIPEIIFSSWLLWLFGLSIMYYNTLLKPSIQLQKRFVKLCWLSAVISILILSIPIFAIIAWGINNVVWYALPIAIILIFGPLLAQLIASAMIKKGWRKIGLSVAYSPYLTEFCLMIYIMYNIFESPKWGT